MHIVSFDRRNLLYYLVTLLRLYLFTCLMLLGSATASGAEISKGAEPTLKKVTIRKQFGSAQGMLRKETDGAFIVEVIRDKEGLKKGLSLRASMPEGHGMLFVLDPSQEHAFWMKGMRFPLDIIFIGREMKITEILENLQPCGECTVYVPKKRPAYALEINAGQATKRGIAIGDTLVIEK